MENEWNVGGTDLIIAYEDLPEASRREVDEEGGDG